MCLVMVVFLLVLLFELNGRRLSYPNSHVRAASDVAFSSFVELDRAPVNAGQKVLCVLILHAQLLINRLQR